MSDQDEGILGVDDDFGMDSEDGEKDQDVLNLDQNDSDDDEPVPGDDNMGGASQFPKPERPQQDGGLGETEKVENQPFDEAVEINDSEDIDSEDDEEDGGAA